MKQEYTTPSIQLLGTVEELTAGSGNPTGCYGEGTLKTFSNTDGYGHAETGCAIS